MLHTNHVTFSADQKFIFKHYYVTAAIYDMMSIQGPHPQSLFSKVLNLLLSSKVRFYI